MEIWIDFYFASSCPYPSWAVPSRNYKRGLDVGKAARVCKKIAMKMLAREQQEERLILGEERLILGEERLILGEKEKKYCESKD